MDLTDRLLREASVRDDELILVDTIINHQLDIGLLEEIGRSLAKSFRSAGISKVLTAESSGIAVACFTARAAGVPAVYAKKFHRDDRDGDYYESEIHSFSTNKSYSLRVARKLLSEDDVVLIVDDFLSNGFTVLGLCDIVSMAGAELAGVGVVIEKLYKEGGDILRRMGIRVESILPVERLEGGSIVLRSS